MRDLAVHAANTGANDRAAVQADQAQINNSIQSLNKIAEETQFGGRKLLDGTAGIKSFIDGTAVMNGDFSYATGLTDGASIHVKITTAAEQAVLSSAATYAQLAAGALSSTATYADTTSTLIATGCISINGSNITYTSGTTTVATLMGCINAVKDTTGVQATFDATTNKIVLTATTTGASTFYATDTATAGSAQIASGAVTGVDWGTFAHNDGMMYVNGIKVNYASGNSVSDLITKINAKKDLTGITASYSTLTNQIDLKSQDYGSDAKINITQSALFLGGQTAANDNGVNAVAQVTKVVGGVEQNVSDAAWQSGSGLESRTAMATPSRCAKRWVRWRRTTAPSSTWESTHFSSRWELTPDRSETSTSARSLLMTLAEGRSRTITCRPSMSPPRMARKTPSRSLMMPLRRSQLKEPRLAPPKRTFSKAA